MPGGRFEYDVDNLLEKQKIVFIMSVSSYSEPYVEGYFIDTKGKNIFTDCMDRHRSNRLKRNICIMLILIQSVKRKGQLSWIIR